MTKHPPILRIAVPTPLRRSFDYLLPSDDLAGELCPGIRLRVPFGNATPVGVLLELSSESTVAHGRLKPIKKVLDHEPLLPDDIMVLLNWASAYYHHPIGDVVMTALPRLLRAGHATTLPGVKHWCLTREGISVDPDSLKNAHRQSALLRLLRQYPDGASSQQLDELGNWRDSVRRLIARNWVETITRPGVIAPANNEQSPFRPTLNSMQKQAVDAVLHARGAYQSFLLDGVTGSGKTEVYLNIIEHIIADDRQAMVLVPEISLTPQTVDRFRQRFNVPVAVLHSGLSDKERLHAWLMARDGSAPIIIGTRSAVFTPLQKPGVIIIDEEHDLSFKQQDGFRYHARDVAVIRARNGQFPIVLGSATPSLESLYNVNSQRYKHLDLPERVGNAGHPIIHAIDVRNQPMDQGLSHALLEVMSRHLDQGGQVLLFLNRRGFAPALMCHGCGWTAGCSRCDARMTLHQGRQLLRCHHCGHESPIIESCPDCQQQDLQPVGQGTERVEQALQRRFPDTGIVRIDRDSTRRKGSMARMLDDIRSGKNRILIGTQMLAKGHHFPEVTLVGVLDADYGLFGTDFRSGERMTQLIIQVAGRAGRAEKPGEVYVQTHHPNHPLMQTLLTSDYNAFARQALAEREETGLPPFSAMAMLRAESVKADEPMTFLTQVLDTARSVSAGKVEFLGPVPAPMEKRAGRYRAQLLLQAEQRADLHRLINACLPKIETLKLARKVRWSLDIDPMEMI